MEYIIKPYNNATARRITDGTIKGYIQTRSGNNVRILCDDAKGEYPLIGLVEDELCERPMQWTLKGKYIALRKEPHRHDLVMFVQEKGGDQ